MTLHLHDVKIEIKTMFLSLAVIGMGDFSRARIPLGFTFFCERKNLLAVIFLNFKITFLGAWGCASDFLKMLRNAKWPPEVNSNFFVGVKL